MRVTAADFRLVKGRPRRERDVQAAILDALQRTVPGFWWRNNTGALKDRTGRLVRYGVPGMPDILGVMPPHGRMVAIECKRKGEKPNPLQQATLYVLSEVNAKVIVAYSVDDVLEALR